jgi:hypothetical protein
MANVFGGQGANCGDGGVVRSIPISRDYYTKADINRFLKLKADLSAVYTEAEVDEKLSDLESAINLSLNGYVTDAELTSGLEGLENSLLSYFANNYYLAENLYTKAEVDNLLSALDVGNGFIKAEPTLQSEAFIDAGDADVIALKLKASASSNITDVQTWIDHENNTIGRVLKSGQVDFYGNMRLGENIPDWKPALDVNERRIGGVADPMDRLDAINKKYMEDYITEVIDNVVQGDDKNYIVDALVY